MRLLASAWVCIAVLSPGAFAADNILNNGTGTFVRGKSSGVSFNFPGKWPKSWHVYLGVTVGSLGYVEAGYSDAADGTGQVHLRQASTQIDLKNSKYCYRAQASSVEECSLFELADHGYVQLTADDHERTRINPSSSVKEKVELASGGVNVGFSIKNKGISDSFLVLKLRFKNGRVKGVRSVVAIATNSPSEALSPKLRKTRMAALKKMLKDVKYR